MKNRGFFQIIIAIVVIILILTFLRLDIRSLVESGTGKSNFAYVWELIVKGWNWFWDLIILFLTKIATLIKNLTK